MKRAIVINVMAPKDYVLNSGDQWVEAEGFAIIKVHSYQPCWPALHVPLPQALIRCCLIMSDAS